MKPSPSIHDGWTPQPHIQEQEQPTDAEPCDHEWEFIDDSFDHEWGCEQAHSWECHKCGETVYDCPTSDDR